MSQSHVFEQETVKPLSLWSARVLEPDQNRSQIFARVHQNRNTKTPKTPETPRPRDPETPKPRDPETLKAPKPERSQLLWLLTAVSYIT